MSMGYDGVAVAVPVSWGYTKRSNHGAAYFLSGALRELLARSGLGKAEVDGLAVSSFTLAPDTAVGFTQYAGLSPRWLEHIPTGGACGVVALRRAARAVQCGDAEVVACLAGDTANFGSFRGLMQNFSTMSRDFVYPHGAGGPNASFALIADHYMREFGATREDFGRVAVSQRANAAEVPHALLRRPLSLEDYLRARPVAEPIHLLDCVMPCAGAEAFLVMTTERARALGLAHARVLGTIERHNAFPEDPVQYRGGWLYDRDALYEQAGLGPSDMDFLETYDDYPVISMMQIEDLGFCGKGEGPAFVRARDLTAAGDFPHNTCGGQLSVGQAGAAGGYLGLVEGLRQLTGQALGTPVEGARHGLVSGFGMINYDRGLCTAAAVLGEGGA
ncbi:thiolase family protein [Arhodomonas sp. SL1]|uniref:thiolase family protein n=1 Tax=Arhodomonas sp. SL1 TaxID=3425691 RepID=UPI003F882BB9